MKKIAVNPYKPSKRSEIMKKIVLVLLAAVFVLSFCSCGNKTSDISEPTSAGDLQADLRQKFEDGIKITQTYCDDREENIEDFPFDVTFYRTGNEPDDSYGHQHFQLMFKLKEEFSEYSTYKIRISYYDEEICNSGEYSSEDIFSTRAAGASWPYHISFELSGEGLETIVSGKVKGEDLWSFVYRYNDVTNNEYWDASKPIKIMLSDMGSFFF